MHDDNLSWEALLPPIFAAAGVDCGPTLTVEPLTGGVSSDIVRITLADGRLYCAKRALSKLKVASDWQAPLERNHYEVAWLRRANTIVPGAAPRVIGEDQAHGIALLEYLPAEDYVLWKAELLAGRADPEVPVAVADALGRIHAATLNDPSAAAQFPTDHLIDALRLDPYLRFTAGRHPDLADRILAVLETTASTRLALVHGDVSPKNILVSRRDGHPVLLDAECAWYGDPAFDGAFCLNHLLLKSIHLPAIGDTLLDQATAFASTWLGHFPASLRAEVEARTATLLPCLMLARVDGKSPVEYLSDENRQVVRDRAIPHIRKPPADLVHLFDSLRSSR
ncbi:aminoglycoside phosphotransferase family protein [Devosia sp. ZB163]|uniref:phosphotransferase family protein n=1 Tax=Devosia sp. ZB163 TaxID=3025938 RepID=UPI002361B88B|nr:aminoglycoside phosphotransferase family protein [Devosia sp. ZB163]MDC9822319.1 aminoglycoside phosphotransferase family protein [Devosia sp. ZB163]